jgi:hypothetical protein
MPIRLFRSILLAGVLALSLPAAATAQSHGLAALEQSPVRLSVTLPLERPGVNTRGLLAQTGAGIVGGLAGMGAVGIPLMLAAWGNSVNEAVGITLLGGAYFTGTVAGIHYAGRAQGMRGNPWATAGGILGGLVLAGAAMQPFIDDEGNVEGPAPLLAFVAPSMGGTAGYAMTRSAR